MAFTPAKKRKIIEAILAEYAKGQYSIKSICSNQGINYSTFLRWESEMKKQPAKTVVKPVAKNDQNATNEAQADRTEAEENTPGEKQPFQPSYSDAKEKRYEVQKGRLKELAITALEKYLSTWEVEERTQTGEKQADGTIKNTKMQITKKIHLPPPMLVRFTLENMFPDDFKTRKEVNQTGENPWIELMKIATLKPDSNDN
jgi:hypothetical protein